MRYARERITVKLVIPKKLYTQEERPPSASDSPVVGKVWVHRLPAYSRVIGFSSCGLPYLILNVNVSSRAGHALFWSSHLSFRACAFVLFVPEVSRFHAPAPLILCARTFVLPVSMRARASRYNKEKKVRTKKLGEDRQIRTGRKGQVEQEARQSGTGRTGQA